jgi:hypothetical protein
MIDPIITGFHVSAFQALSQDRNPVRVFTWDIEGNQSVVFRHVSPRNFAYKGKLIPMLVQALKALGKEHVTEEHKEMIRKLLRQYPEPDTINYDLTLPPRWIKKIFVELKK